MADFEQAKKKYTGRIKPGEFTLQVPGAGSLMPKQQVMGKPLPPAKNRNKK